MPYPYQIDPADLTSWASPPAPAHFCHAVYNGSYYTVLQKWEESAGDEFAYLEVWKSSDRGVTWAQVDSANRKKNLDDSFSPPSGLPPGNVNFDAVQDGSELHVVYYQIDNTYTMSIATFDMATDLWGTVRTGGPSGLQQSGAGGAIFLGNSWSIVVRNSVSDKFLVAFNYQNPGAKGRVRFATCTDAGSWSAATELSIDTTRNIRLLGIGLDASTDLTHVIVQVNIQIFPPGEVARYGQKEISSTNTVGSYEEILDGEIAFPDSTTFRPGSVFVTADNLELYFGLGVVTFTGGIFIAILYAIKGDLSQSPVVWSWSQIDQLTDPSLVYNHQQVTILEVGGGLWAIWGRANNFTTYANEVFNVIYLSKRPSLTWSAVQTVYDAGVTPHPMMLRGVVVPGAVGIIFGDDDLNKANLPLNYWQEPVVSSNGVDAGQGNVVI